MPGGFIKTLVIAAAAATMALLAVPAGAMPLAPGAGAENSSLLIEVANGRPGHNNGWRYDKRYHGNRYNYRRHGYSYFYGGFYYASPWWTFGPAYVAPYNARPYAGYGGNAHVRWCLNHYRSYNPRTNTFVGGDGYRHQCYGPY